MLDSSNREPQLQSISSIPFNDESAIPMSEMLRLQRYDPYERDSVRAYVAINFNEQEAEENQLNNDIDEVVLPQHNTIMSQATYALPTFSSQMKS